MVHSSNGLQFRLHHLFALVLISCVVLAAIANEPLNIAVATIFFCVSSIAISTLVGISARNLLEVVTHSIRTRRLSHLSRRFKWLMVDTVIATWLVVAIVAGNFVFDNHEDRSDLVILGPVIVGFAGWYGSFIPARADSIESNESGT